MRNLVACVGVCLGAAACTNAELCVEPCATPTAQIYDDAVQFEGDACTATPAAVSFPYKILFVIDDSGSNLDSDPNGNRAAAVARVINQYSGNTSVWYGVIQFATNPKLLTPAFTQDTSTLLNYVVPQLTQQLDMTDYMDTLAMATQFLGDDMRSLSTAELARTRYDVQWLSDGEPNPCVPVTTITAATNTLMSLSQEYHPFDLRLSTTRLDFAGFVSECAGLGTQYGDPTTYLRAMANTGGGTFQDLQSGQLNFNITFVDILRRFESHDFYVINTSRVVIADQAWPDSDRDGIPDKDDPYALTADAAKDGCSDMVVQALQPNQGLCQAQCAGKGTIDTDGDTIPDCAEMALGYDSTKADTDNDGFPDDVELRFGTNALDPKTLTVDTDRDGVVDAEEIRLGTNPLVPDAGTTWDYAYGAFAPIDPTTAGTSCFGVDVENVRLVQTLATPTSNAGDNVICIYMVQASVDNPEGPTTVTRSCHVPNYQQTSDGDLKIPANGKVEVAPADFTIAYK